MILILEASESTMAENRHKECLGEAKSLTTGHAISEFQPTLWQNAGLQMTLIQDIILMHVFRSQRQVQ